MTHKSALDFLSSIKYLSYQSTTYLVVNNAWTFMICINNVPYVVQHTAVVKER